MITKEEIDKLANLARIKINNSEKEGLAKEIDSILVYVDQIKKATLDMDHTPKVGSVSNIYRDDIAKDRSKEDNQTILDEAPFTEGDFVAVKKIISQD